jgi:hypothetical protein
MKIASEELIGVLSQFNPWWRSEHIPDISTWKRTVFKELYEWVTNPPSHRALMLSGARQIGKTTLLLQTIQELLDSGVPAGNILYVTFDHPLLKLAGIDTVLEAWRQREPKKEGVEYLFLDEAQFIRDWGTWVKHQIDFVKQRRIVFTGSTMPLTQENQESGVGRWHTLKLTTLTFYEYLQIKKLELPELPKVSSIKDVGIWEQDQYYRTIDAAKPYVAHFHEYLVRGGFPQTALMESITAAQKLMREDIIDKVLKRDMTALFGVRRILDLEHTFLYLCMHDGGILDMQTLSSNLGVKRPTAQNFIELLESAHLIYRLQPFGYGKEVLRGRSKVYMSDPAIAPAVLLKGKGVIDDPKTLGVLAESATLKTLYSYYSKQNARFSYFHADSKFESDIIVEADGELIPFEVKYTSQSPQISDLKGLMKFCTTRSVEGGYVVTKNLDDFGYIQRTKLIRIPAALLCYWMGH